MSSLLAYCRSERRDATPMDPRVGLGVRLAVEVVVFVILLFNGVWVLDHAARHSDYIARGTNFYFDFGAPTYGNAAWALAVGPVLQVVAFASLMRAFRRRRTRVQALRITSWAMLGVDILVGLVLVATASFAVL